MFDPFGVRRSWDAAKQKGFVDAVSWILVVLGGAGLAMSVLQAPVVLLAEMFRGHRAQWAFTVVNFAVLLVVGLGLRRRQPWARIGLLLLLGTTILWYAYCVVAMVNQEELPLVPVAFLRVNEFRIVAIGAAAFWSGVFGWLCYRLLRADVRAEFGGRDV